MKKVKLMLFSIMVLAVVGAALAFKAKKFNLEYCYDSIHLPQFKNQLTNQFCTSSITTSTAEVGSPLQLRYVTPTDDPEACIFNVNCIAKYTVPEQ